MEAAQGEKRFGSPETEMALIDHETPFSASEPPFFFRFPSLGPNAACAPARKERSDYAVRTSASTRAAVNGTDDKSTHHLVSST